MNIPLSLNMLFMIAICQGFEYAKNTEGFGCAWVSSCVSLTCQNMPEAEPEITKQAK